MSALSLEQIGGAIGKLQDLQKEAGKDSKMLAFEGLIDEISVALSDLVSAIENRPDHGKELVSGLVDAIRAIKLPAASEPKITVSPSTVAVQVSPTPITVEAVMPAGPAPVVNVTAAQGVGSEWTMKIPGAHGWPDRTVTIRKTK